MLLLHYRHKWAQPLLVSRKLFSWTVLLPTTNRSGLPTWQKTNSWYLGVECHAWNYSTAALCKLISKTGKVEFRKHSTSLKELLKSPIYSLCHIQTSVNNFLWTEVRKIKFCCIWFSSIEQFTTVHSFSRK